MCLLSLELLSNINKCDAVQDSFFCHVLSRPVWDRTTEEKWVWGIFSSLRKCGICRLLVEQLSGKPTVLVAFCRIPDNEHRLCLWRSASFPLFALASQVAQLSHYQFSFLQDTLFLLLTACLCCWWWLKFTFLSVPHKVITTLLQINADFTVSNHNKAAFRCSDSLTIPSGEGGAGGSSSARPVSRWMSVGALNHSPGRMLCDQLDPMGNGGCNKSSRASGSWCIIHGNKLETDSENGTEQVSSHSRKHLKHWSGMLRVTGENGLLMNKKFFSKIGHKSTFVKPPWWVWRVTV